MLRPWKYSYTFEVKQSLIYGVFLNKKHICREFTKKHYLLMKTNKQCALYKKRCFIEKQMILT